MNWVFGVLCASSAVHAFVGAYVLLVWSRDTSARDLGMFALVTFFQLGFAVTRVSPFAYDTPMDERFGLVCLAGGLALVAHHAIHLSRGPTPRGLLAATYALATLLAASAVLGFVEDDAGPTELSGLGLFQRSPVWPFMVLFCALLVLVGIATYRLVLRYLRGDTELLPTTAGHFLLLAIVAHEILTREGVLPGPPVGQLGLFAFTCGGVATYCLRYTSVAQELESRTRELEHATTKLRMSYRDLRETQEELVRKEQLAAVGELAAVVAHEVRNPLAIITNAVAGLRKPTLSREDQGTLLGIVEEETHRLNRLVLDLLRYARPVNVQKSSIALKSLLDRALNVARIGAKGVELTTRFDIEDTMVLGDANLLRQVFDNLVDNAVQAMGAGGTLTIHVEREKNDEREGVAIHIRDTGEGMDTIVRMRARDPFFTTRPSGTGLGLAIVDRIVEAHDGHLLIESRAGEGTTVTVCLPCEPPTSNPTPPPEGKT